MVQSCLLQTKPDSVGSKAENIQGCSQAVAEKSPNKQLQVRKRVHLSYKATETQSDSESKHTFIQTKKKSKEKILIKSRRRK